MCCNQTVPSPVQVLPPADARTTTGEHIEVSVAVYIHREDVRRGVVGSVHRVLGPRCSVSVRVLPPGDLVTIRACSEDVEVSVSIQVRCVDGFRSPGVLVHDVLGPAGPVADHVLVPDRVAATSYEYIDVSVAVHVRRVDGVGAIEVRGYVVLCPVSAVAGVVLPPGDVVVVVFGCADDIEVSIAIHVRSGDSHGFVLVDVLYGPVSSVAGCILPPADRVDVEAVVRACKNIQVFVAVHIHRLGRIHVADIVDVVLGPKTPVSERVGDRVGAEADVTQHEWVAWAARRSHARTQREECCHHCRTTI